MSNNEKHWGSDITKQVEETMRKNNYGFVLLPFSKTMKDAEQNVKDNKQGFLATNLEEDAFTCAITLAIKEYCEHKNISHSTMANEITKLLNTTNHKKTDGTKNDDWQEDLADTIGRTCENNGLGFIFTPMFKDADSINNENIQAVGCFGNLDEDASLVALTLMVLTVCRSHGITCEDFCNKLCKKTMMADGLFDEYATKGDE